LSALFADKKLVVVLEEHGLTGGAGSAVLEWGNAKRVALDKLVCIGAPDRFLSACGDQDQARALYGLVPDKISERVLERLK
jgi:transketolase